MEEEIEIEGEPEVEKVGDETELTIEDEFDPEKFLEIVLTEAVPQVF